MHDFNWPTEDHEKAFDCFESVSETLDLEGIDSDTYMEVFCCGADPSFAFL